MILIFCLKKGQHEHSKYLSKLQNQVNNSVYVTFISESTSRIANKYLDIKPGIKTKIIYQALQLIDDPETMPPWMETDEQFLFSIGQLNSKKNYHVLIPFIKELPGNIKLIIAGDTNTEYATLIKNSIKEYGLQERVILPGKVSEGEKSYLYNKCLAFVFPSIAEGFGLPIIEAMHYKKPVFCSIIDSLYEIGKGYTYHWENFEPENMATIFINGMKDFSMKNAFQIQEMKNYADSFTMSKNVKSYLEIYREILNNPDK